MTKSSKPNASKQIDSGEFAARLLAWFDQHGRKDLPWQHNTTPYRVWVSEIMLQQTQVATVIPYYERFMQAFPDVQALAAAPEDEVLHLWTGLGYYARARNLHKAAKRVCDEYQGAFPTELDALQSLPGIGRSTAGAIRAIAAQEFAVILDGNVKRVLTRLHRVAGWPGKRAVELELWALAEACTPHTRVADYTQAIMDLGATLCTRSKPDCARCPVQQQCQALAHDDITAYPASQSKTDKPRKAVRMLLIENEAGEFLLQKRPASGIWGGLWSLPELALSADPLAFCASLPGVRKVNPGFSEHEVRRHSFSHYHLDMTPTRVQVQSTALRVEERGQLWYNTASPADIGLAAPVKRLLHEADPRTGTASRTSTKKSTA